MENLLIIGAGGIGIQIADAVEEINRSERQWNLRGFLDDDEKKQGIDVAGYPILGRIEDTKKFRDCMLVLALGNSKNYYIRKRVFKKLGIESKRYATIIHPSATVSRHATLGYGSVVLAGARVMANTLIGNHAFILANAYVGHDDVIQDFVTITNSASVSGMSTVEEGCYIGANSSVLERIVVGKWSLIGLGSVVLKDVPAFSVVVGNPGKVTKTQDQSTFNL